MLMVHKFSSKSHCAVLDAIIALALRSIVRRERERDQKRYMAKVINSNSYSRGYYAGSFVDNNIMMG